MQVLLLASERFLEHVNAPGHPEAPERLASVVRGIHAAGVFDAITVVAPRPARPDELTLVHDAGYLERLRRFCANGGGRIDLDTGAVPESWEAALLAAGAGPTVIGELSRSGASAAFCAVRPPGHHALTDEAMGFCLLNNVAVAAAVLADRGERVLIVDWDAHHGNGTQAIFYDDPRVAYVSLHQFPFYPGTGRLSETGAGAGAGSTINVPLPAGATGDVYRAAFDSVIAPFADRFGATWLIVSAGFDAHRQDPLTNLGLTSGDFADLAADVLSLVPPGRRIAFLEGGYDDEGLAFSAGATVAAMAGERYAPEPPTAGGPGARAVEQAADLTRNRSIDGEP